MSYALVEVTSSLFVPPVHEIKTGSRIWIPSLMDTVIVAAIDGQCAAIGKYGHRIAGHAPHPGMGKPYSAETLRKILGMYATTAEVFDVPGKRIIPAPENKTTTVCNLKSGDVVSLTWCGQPFVLVIVSPKMNSYAGCQIAGPNIGHLFNTMKDLTTESVLMAFATTSDARILETHEIPGEVAKTFRAWKQYKNSLDNLAAPSTCYGNKTSFPEYLSTGGF